MDNNFSGNNRSESVSFALQSVILMFALCLYLAVWFLMSFDENAFLQIDSADYRFLGKAIFNDFNFPSSFRTPVFPVFQGFWESFLGLSVSHYILVQILLAVSNIYLLGRLVSFFVGPKWQLAAMFVMSLDLITIQVANYVLSETLFSFLLLLSLNLLQLINVSSKNRYGLAIVCGLTFGLFSLCRPVGQFIPFILIPWVILYRQEDHSIKSRCVVSAIIVIISLSCVHAWKFNNLINKGHYFTSITTSFNMYNYRAAWNVAYRDGRTFEDVKDEFHANRSDFKRQNPLLSEYEIGRHFTKEGFHIILSTPKETFFQAVRGLIFLYGGIYNGSLERVFQDHQARIAAQGYSLLYSLLLYFGVLLSLFYWKHFNAQQRSLFALSGLVIFYFTFFSIGVESYARLRAPFMPYLVLLSVLGWISWLQKRFFIRKRCMKKYFIKNKE